MSIRGCEIERSETNGNKKKEEIVRDKFLDEVENVSRIVKTMGRIIGSITKKNHAADSRKKGVLSYHIRGS